MHGGCALNEWVHNECVGKQREGECAACRVFVECVSGRSALLQPKLDFWLN